jgi:hypothetical protein
MKIQIELEGDAQTLKDLLLQAAAYTTDPVAGQVGMNLTLANSCVKGCLVVEPTVTGQSLEEQALRELRTVWTELNFSCNRHTVIQCAAARLTESGMNYEAAKNLVVHIMDNQMI